MPGHATASLLEAAAHLSKTDALTYATVNATILGLLFALSTAVGVIWLQTIDRLNRVLFDKAHEINGVKRPMKWQLQDYSAADLSSDELIEMMRVIVTGEDFPEEDFAPPGAPAARGLLLVHCFGVIAGRYPFAASGPPDRHTDLVFETREEVTIWLDHLKESVQRCELLLNVGSLKMRELATAGVGDQLAKVREAAPEFIPMPVDDFGRFMSGVSQIATQTELLVAQLARYRRSRLPGRALVVTATVVSSVVFVSGIVYPMIANRPWSPPVSWLPGAFYTTLLLAGCTFIFRRYRPTGREARR